MAMGVMLSIDRNELIYDMGLGDDKCYDQIFDMVYDVAGHEQLHYTGVGDHNADHGGDHGQAAGRLSPAAGLAGGGYSRVGL
eukprot:11935619-Heterocapsa_arctica.AAC.1